MVLCQNINVVLVQLGGLVLVSALLKIERLVVLVPYRLWWAKCLNEADPDRLRISQLMFSLIPAFR